MDVSTEIRSVLTPDEQTAALALIEAAARADGVGPISEHGMLWIRYGGPARALLVYADGELAGYAHVEPDGTEFVVHPGRRGQGLGRRLLDGALELGAKKIWAHGDHPAAAALARAAGLDRVRALWQMRRPLAEPFPEPRLPEGVRLRAFVPGADEEEWLGVNSRAFATHPEQGKWTRSDIDQREAEAWFDPAGFLIADRGGRMAGFHWTKVEDGVGEVYVVGVDPSEQGTGLGRALTLAGLAHLRDRGLELVTLYVDEENRPAVKLYESLGFEHFGTDVMYA
ncbi:mycothiol synthase [Bailinhaonella thermotolerans]|uniref:Mycothiol acetyltransferase n=1 Tax=Bailinhaonella thermotolerans TaxID=1070861 RepID=A0A3A4AMW0_9ACTN|nr:mycothiol synthase [Bailinhaonella thermotolerans]